MRPCSSGFLNDEIRCEEFPLLRLVVLRFLEIGVPPPTDPPVQKSIKLCLLQQVPVAKGRGGLGLPGKLEGSRQAGPLSPSPHARESKGPRLILGPVLAENELLNKHLLFPFGEQPH